ncbi:TPA: hypothetical protein DDY56_03135 [Candidatus Uhrbacteria bacterium]|nr:hypothetical protein [Candidatus Uhrbacteria bacterium]HAN06375.1 hypothetical protein [Candidatus Uhrbacteria bacterium]HAP65668.1 hypothetical protein [Candidatus Uhrbacteria bacterium]HBA51529.1 hypothetical protein [Candidatus Uhrbacteria bacterium]HBJ62583.1 hypothetical protein [Candidatus Uhrbacteria bacterium]
MLVKKWLILAKSSPIFGIWHVVTQQRCHIGSKGNYEPETRVTSILAIIEAVLKLNSGAQLLSNPLF